MKIYTDLSNYTSKNKTFVTIGTFDGVHIGHQKVLSNLINSAKKNNATAVLLTFFPHPRMVLQKDTNIKLINTINERIKLLEKTGLDTLVIHEFTKDFAEKTALDFVKKVLVDDLKISKLIIGYDHRFGKNREGNFEQLSAFGKTFGFEVTKISQQEIDHIAISSTKIRKAIELGNIEEANRYLGYNFMLTGEIVKGNNLGEKIGFPTANLEIKESYKLLPKTGSYVVKSALENETVYGMMNIGYNPTVKGKKQTIEIHFFDFNKDLYGKKIQIDVLKFLRDEQKFDSVEDLKNQLLIDKQKSLKIIEDNLFDL
ncbi:MAG: bifunctional riboflavin kinase/FAD synthetase [Lutibacter sp.]